jgi:lambda family phage minor tail protein L
MGRGQDIIASSLLDLQPTAVLEFFRIYPDTINKPTTFIPFHGGSIFKNNVTWQGTQYIPLPVESEGFEVSANGQLPRPKIRIANKDYLITSLLQNNQDFKNAKVVRKRTFIKFLDDINFDGGNPFGTADSSAEISNEDYLIGQKTAENKLYVEFELTSPLDLDNFEVNSRKILAKYCYWQYRGCGCNYNGSLIEQENGKAFMDADGNNITPLSASNPPTINTSDMNTNPAYEWNSSKSYVKGQLVYVENPNIILNLPKSPFLKTWYICAKNNSPTSTSAQNPEGNPTYWLKDGCTKKIQACKKRFNTSKTVDVTITSDNFSIPYIGVSGNTSPTKFSITGSKIVDVLNSDFTLAGWAENIGFINYGGIFETTSDSSNNGFKLFYNNKKYYLNYNFKSENKDEPIIAIIPQTGLCFYSLNHRAAYSSPHNYIKYSKDFDNSYWSKNSTSVSNVSSVTTGFLSPNGLNEACLLSGNTGKNPGLFINNFTNNIETDASAYSPRPFKNQFTDYKQNLLFSINVKQVDSPYFYIRFSTYDPGAKISGSQFVVFDTSKYQFKESKLSLTNGNSTQDKNNAGVYIYPTDGSYSGWMKLYCSVDRSIENTGYLTDINFGPLSGSYTYATGLPQVIKKNYYYDIYTPASQTKKSCYIWGAQLECITNSPSAYIKTTGKSFFHKNLNLDDKESIRLEVNTVLALEVAATNCSQRFKNQNSGLSFGIQEYQTDKIKNKSNEQNYVTWNLWSKFLDSSLSDGEVDKLYHPITKPTFAPAQYNYYPLSYNSYTGLYPLSSSYLFGWWDFYYNGSYIPDSHTGNNNLTLSGQLLDNQLSYIEEVYRKETKITSNEMVRFGGFPGTDAFGYG